MRASRRELRARERQQRPREDPGPELPERDDAAQAADPGATHHPQQQRLELIVGVMSGQQPFRWLEQAPQRAVAHIARRGFQALAARAIHRNAQADVLDAERGSGLRAPLAPVRGIRMQPVIDMRGTQARAEIEAPQRGEQHGRVETAAEGDRHARGRRVREPAVEHRTQLGQERQHEEINPL